MKMFLRMLSEQKIFVYWRGMDYCKRGVEGRGEDVVADVCYPVSGYMEEYLRVLSSD